MASDIYYISGEKEYIIPKVEQFIVSEDPESGIIVRLIDGFES